MRITEQGPIMSRHEEKSRCQDCFELGGKERSCPYELDINGEFVDVTLCNSCYEDRRNEAKLFSHE